MKLQGLRAASRCAARQQPPTVLSIQSHVVSGAAGNSAAVFPMRRLGVNVWPLNTVQFSNHTQYGKWKGHVFPPEHITEIVDGIDAIGSLPKIDAVLSGYLGSEAQGAAVLDTVRRVREANPKAVYCCDPVMGHPEKGCIVAPGVAEFFAREAVLVADILCPNTLELGLLTGQREAIGSFNDVRAAADKLLERSGAKAVCVKHLGSAGLSGGTRFEMLLTSTGADAGSWLVSVPLIPFGRPPVGVGDLTSGVLLAQWLLGHSWLEALRGTVGVYHAVMTATAALGEYELQLVAAQDAWSCIPDDGDCDIHVVRL